MVIGLTGLSGSGKSAVADILAEFDIIVIDCDKLAHKNMEIGGAAYNDIINAFGREILNDDNTVNRKILGNIVFNNKNKLNILNTITHKYIVSEVKAVINKTDKNVVIDAPLLFEAGLDKLCNTIWAVICPDSIRLERVMKRDNISAEAAMLRFKNQKSAEFFKERADVIFDNSRDMASLRERVLYEINKIPV